MPRYVETAFAIGGLRVVISQGNLLSWFRDGVEAEEQAVINAANEELLGAVGDDEDYDDDFGGGGVDAALHHAAGPALRQECAALPEVSLGVRCPTGEARRTSSGGGGLRVGHVIHAVAPVYPSYAPEVAEGLLRDAFHSALLVAAEGGIKCVAFPALGCGLFGCPVEVGARSAMEACSLFASQFTLSPCLEVHFVLYKRMELEAWLTAAAATSAAEQGGRD